MKYCLSIIVLLVCSLAACVPQRVENNRLQTAGTYTSVSAPDMVFPSDTLFSWAREKSHVYNDPRFDDIDMKRMLRVGIEDALGSRGYRIADRGGNYLVSYVAALEGALSDDDLDKIFGINPGLPSQNRSGLSYEKGTIIIDISSPEDQRSLWRSAMQGYVADNLSKRERKDRIKRIVEQMFNSFPYSQKTGQSGS